MYIYIHTYIYICIHIYMCIYAIRYNIHIPVPVESLPIDLLSRAAKLPSMKKIKPCIQMTTCIYPIISIHTHI